MPTRTKKVPENIPQEPVNELSIKDEEQFRDIIQAEKEKHAQESQYGNIAELTNQLHNLLKQQDSETCLSVITRGALEL